MRMRLALRPALSERAALCALCALCALPLEGCLEEPKLTYPAPSLDFGAPAAPLAPRLDPDPSPELPDLSVPDMDPVDQGPPLGPPRLRSLGLSWVGAPQERAGANGSEARLEGSFEWVSGALEATSEQ